MANKKISELPAATGLTADDLLVTVDSPGGTPVTKKLTGQQLIDYLTPLLPEGPIGPEGPQGEQGLQGETGLQGEPGAKTLGLVLFQSDVDVAIGDGKSGMPIPASINGYLLSDVLAAVNTKGATGATTIQVRRVRAGAAADMLNSALSLGDVWYVNGPSINTSSDDVATGDMIYFDVDGIHTTPPKGLSVILTFTAP